MGHQEYDPAQDQPEPGDVHSRYATLGGALVIMRHAAPSPYDPALRIYDWECKGCHAHVSPSVEDNTRDSANAHAGTCRAMPPVWST